SSIQRSSISTGRSKHAAVSRARMSGLATTATTLPVARTAALVDAAWARPRSVRGTSDRPSSTRERLAAVCPWRTRINTTWGSPSAHEDAAALVTADDRVGRFTLDAIDLGGREREVAPGARALHQSGRADAAEPRPQLLVEGEQIGWDGRDGVGPRRLFGGQLGVDCRLGFGDGDPQLAGLRVERPTVGVELVESRIERLALRHRLEDLVLQSGLAPLQRLRIGLHGLELARRSDRARVHALLQHDQLLLERSQLVLQLLLMAGHPVALAPDLGGGRLECLQPLAHRVEPGPVGQGGATVAELLDRGVVLLHDEKLVEGGHGGVPPSGVAPGSTV